MLWVEVFPTYNSASAEGRLGLGPAKMIAYGTRKRDKCLLRFDEAPILFLQEVPDT